jgi:hypothetical protein
VEGVDTDTHVERLLSGRLDDVLVGANTGGLESLRGELLVLVRDEVAAEGEVIDGSPLAAQVVDPDLGVGDTTVVPRLGEPVDGSERVGNRDDKACSGEKSTYGLFLQ